MEDVADRLAASRRAMDELGAAIVAREPWALSDAYGAEPESSWGPREVLAHVAEMLPYWLGQMDALVAAPGQGEAPAFGRVATDTARIERIGRDRELPIRELHARIDAGLSDVLSRLGELTPEDRGRRGIHPRLGEMTVDGIVDRFIVGHLEEHVRQLDDILATDTAAPPAPTG
jgi:hypothetical protein